MSLLVACAVGGFVALLVSLAVVPAISRIAVHRNLLDFPDDDRHGHVRPVPRLGGVAVIAGLVAGLPFMGLGHGELFPHWTLQGAATIVTPVVILFTIGLLDDLYGVRPLWKLVAQTAAAMAVVSLGVRLDEVQVLPGFSVHLGMFGPPLLVLWLIGMSNAFNLVDGLDGLAGGVAVIALATIGCVAVAFDHPSGAFVCVALIGALLGFLRYNWSPARIFLGDCGSLVVGFLLALLSVESTTRSDGVTFVLVPLLALSYPLLDTGIAMLRRWLRGQPLSRADGRHIHHQVQALLLSPARAVRIIYIQAAFLAGLGLCIAFAPPSYVLAFTAICGGLLVFMLVYGVKWLEYHEFLEAGASIASGFRRARWTIRDRINARDVARLIPAVTSTDELNAILKQWSGTFRFAHMAFGGPTLATDDVRLMIERTWKIEYPVAHHTNGTRSERNVLTIWCWIDHQGGPAGAERVAHILAPALATWVQHHDTDAPRIEPATRRRPSIPPSSRRSGQSAVPDVSRK